MTDYTLITGIERGHNAFTSTAKSKLITPRENAALARGTKQTRKIEKLRSEGVDVGALHGISAASDERIRQHRALRVNPNSGIGYTDRAGTDKTAAIKFSNSGKTKTHISAN